MESITKTEDALEIFEKVLRSLEIHRPAKTERDLIDQIQEKFGLKGNASQWPKDLVQQKVSVETFLKYVLGLIGPFVEMVISLYDFLYNYASTSGGRTEHFAINSSEISPPWSFDVSRLPREISWIRAWVQSQVEDVNVNWQIISDSLGLDNGIFYGSIDHKRLLQSLIIARRDRTISTDLLALGDRIYGSVKRAVQAWYRGAIRDIQSKTSDGLGDLQLPVYLPYIARSFRDRGRFRSAEQNRVGIDLERVFSGERGDSTAEEVFVEAGSGTDILQYLPELERAWGVHAAVFFSALWGLQEASFQEMALLHRFHDDLGDLLLGRDLNLHALDLGKRLVDDLEKAVTATGNISQSQELIKQRLEVLLLPYWKDRWFLFEVWTLVQVLRQAIRAGAEVELREVSPAQPGIVGTVWNLPTQKAAKPVATLSSRSDSVLVWFQRETPREDDPKRHMEPDIRITTNAGPYVDLAIVECKDRVKFAGADSDKVVHSYAHGSAAKIVWLVNYEANSKQRVRVTTSNGRSSGVANGFRPNLVPSQFRDSLNELLRDQLSIGEHKPAEQSRSHFLLIDTSGSMDGKQLPDSDMICDFLNNKRNFVKLWSDSVSDPNGIWYSISRIQGSGVENVQVLKTFAQNLPDGTAISVITDASGAQQLLGLAIDRTGSEQTGYKYSISGKLLEIIQI